MNKEAFDRFAVGRKDPQEQPLEPIAECSNIECETPIYTGQKVWMKGHLRYCCLKCLADDMGAVKVTID